MGVYRGFQGQDRAFTGPSLLCRLSGIHPIQCDYRVTWSSRTRSRQAAAAATVVHWRKPLSPCSLPAQHSTYTRLRLYLFFVARHTKDTTSQNRPPFPKHNLPRSPFLQINTLNPRPDSIHSTPTASITASIVHSSRKNCRIIRHHGRDPPKTRHRRRRCLR